MNNVISILEDLQPLDLADLADYYSVQNNVNRIADALMVRAKLEGSFILKNLASVYGKKLVPVGEGTYGQVWSTNKSFAIKVIKNSTLAEDENTLREVSILRYVDHPCILKLYAIQLKPLQIAMPLALGTLDEYADLLQGSINLRKRVYYQILNAVGYLHSKYIWHLDIKPINVLVFSDAPNMTVKLADFGISQPYSLPRPGNNMNVVTLWWRAPELLAGDQLYDSKVDVWSVGVMLFTDITGKDFHGSVWTNIGQLQFINSLFGVPKPDQWRRFSQVSHKHFKNKKYIFAPTIANSEEASLLKCMLTWPDVRCTAKAALKHDYFNSVRDTLKLPPIVHQQCGEMYLAEETAPPPTLRVSDPERKALFDKVHTHQRQHKYTDLTLFYAFALFDKIVNEILTADPEHLLWACVVIGSYMYELDPLPLKDYPLAQAKMKELITRILTVREFNMIFPSAAEFLIAYTTQSNTANSLPRTVTAAEYEVLYTIVSFTSSLRGSTAAKYTIDYTETPSCLHALKNECH